MTGVSYIYPVNDNDPTDKNEIVASTSTNESGEYTFKGIIPGHYKVRFVYGNNEIIGETDKKVTAENYKSTIRTGGIETGGEIDYNNDYWYQYDNNKEENKPRYSDALDIWEGSHSRPNFNDKLLTIDYGTQTEFKGNEANTVYAETNTMDVAIEDVEKAVIEYYSDYYNQEDGPSGLIKNIDFGLIERPKQSIKVTKVVRNVKITLANGVVLIDGDPEKIKSPYLVYIDDSELVKIEVDNELLQGSKLEIDYGIKVENLSEIDYSHQMYQWYGTTEVRGDSQKTEEIRDSLVKQTITKMLDNMDSELSTTYEQYEESKNQGAYKLTVDEIRNLYNKKNNGDIRDTSKTQKLSDKTYQAIKDSNNILLLKNIKGLSNISPNEDKEIIVSASKLLTTTSTKDNYFVNYTEVIENENSVGKFMEDSTPGNTDFSTIQGKEPDENAEALTIVPPTGGIKSWHILVVGVIALTILVGGIILIKKRVLDE